MLPDDLLRSPEGACREGIHVNKAGLHEQEQEITFAVTYYGPGDLQTFYLVLPHRLDRWVLSSQFCRCENQVWD